MKIPNTKYQIPNSSPLVVLVGETASGKTAAAIKIAQEVGGEIICADSRTLYKGMDIGTAKPNKAEQELVPHHLIDVVKPNEEFTVAQFQRLALECIQDIVSRGKIPIMVGGSGLYIDSVLYNYQFNSKADTLYRAELEQMNDDELTTLLHTKNINIDGLNTKNRRHVIRAIERGGAAPVDKKLRDNTLVFGLSLDREILKKRVEKRAVQMIKDGFIHESQKLSKMYGWDSEAMSGAGYKAAKEFLEGNISEEDVKQALIKRDLSLAKRQRTWFKRNPYIRWFNSSDELVRVATQSVK